MRRASRKLHCVMAGGDTTRQPKVLINITVVGEVKSGNAVLRSGARPGDIIYVSGRLGEADLGLATVRNSSKLVAPVYPEGRRASLPTPRHSHRAAGKIDPLVRKHLYPEPRIALGRWLADHRLPTAMMDLSDGLSTDLPRLCESSKVGAQIDATKLPTVQFPNRNTAQRHLTKFLDPLSLALNGGDDYELLFTVAADSKPAAFRAKLNGIPLTAIGEITRGRHVTLESNGRNSSLKPAGWDPFRK